VTRLDLAVGPAGVIVPVEVTLSTPVLNRLRAAGLAVPTPVPVSALLDTGSEVTVVDAGVLAPLVGHGLQPSRFVYTNAPSAGGLAPTLEYHLGLAVGRDPRRPRSGLALPAHPVYERALGALGYQALIGRDVLDHCAFFYDGPGRRITLLV
jgi:hypothetical protein